MNNKGRRQLPRNDVSAPQSILDSDDDVPSVRQDDSNDKLRRQLRDDSDDEMPSVHIDESRLNQIQRMEIHDQDAKVNRELAIRDMGLSTGRQESGHRLNPKKSKEIQMWYVQQPIDAEAFDYEFFVPENLDDLDDDFN